MASSLYVQTTTGDKRKAGPVCKHCKNPGGPFGIMGEYVHGRWKTVGYFCGHCAVDSVETHIRPDAIRADIKLLPRSGYSGEDTRTLIAALGRALENVAKERARVQAEYRKEAARDWRPADSTAEFYPGE